MKQRIAAVAATLGLAVIMALIGSGGAATPAQTLAGPLYHCPPHYCPPDW